MYNYIISPPVAFILLFILIATISKMLSSVSYKRKGKMDEGTTKAYASGEEFAEHRVQVDYGQFFPFAFFFTILHVVTLMVTTMPANTLNIAFIAVAYIIGAIISLFILFGG